MESEYYFNIAYEIGGYLSMEDTKCLVSLLSQYHFWIEDFDGADPGNDDALLGNILVCHDESVSIYTESLLAKSIDTSLLDAFCCQHDLSFIKRVQAASGRPGSAMWRTSGMKEIKAWEPCDIYGKRPLIDAETLRLWMVAGRKLEDIVKGLEDMIPKTVCPFVIK